ncbi:unnamed protein product [Lactuca virosa]|uniref:Uncharacterized protein n=1 Tax=Lactuca virosa TaxID=75947 RepID=A0AAU9P3L8_9ASTR|nr:unnamed protein product [Lactuca virosa]
MVSSVNCLPYSLNRVRSSHHRRVHCKVNFRLPDYLDLASDPYDSPFEILYEIGSEEDLLCTYIDIEKLRSN